MAIAMQPIAWKPAQTSEKRTRIPPSMSLQSAEVAKEEADLMHSIYERITVAGPEFVGVRLDRGGLRTDWRWPCRKGL